MGKAFRPCAGKGGNMTIAGGNAADRRHGLAEADEAFDRPAGLCRLDLGWRRLDHPTPRRAAMTGIAPAPRQLQRLFDSVPPS